MSVEEEIRDLIAQGRTRKEISNILGMNEAALTRDYISKMDVRPATETTALPYGLGDNSAHMRIRLGVMLQDMLTAGLSRREIARVTGLNQREQTRAERRPYSHDWLLSQIERTCKYFGASLKDLV